MTPATTVEPAHERDRGPDPVPTWYGPVPCPCGCGLFDDLCADGRGIVSEETGFAISARERPEIGLPVQTKLRSEIAL